MQGLQETDQQMLVLNYSYWACPSLPINSIAATYTCTGFFRKGEKNGGINEGPFRDRWFCPLVTSYLDCCFDLCLSLDRDLARSCSFFFSRAFFFSSLFLLLSLCDFFFSLVLDLSFFDFFLLWVLEDDLVPVSSLSLIISPSSTSVREQRIITSMNQNKHNSIFHI